MAKATTSSSPPASLSSAAGVLYGWVWFGVALYAIGYVTYNAYQIRMGAIYEFGPVIHEFDPYFNYRATEVSRRYRSIFCLTCFGFFAFFENKL
jgi:dolichyl-diphosphooligosaccharide--protein glycosyltransferase